MHIALAEFLGHLLHRAELRRREMATDGLQAHRETVFLLLAHEAALFEFLIID